MGFFFRNGGSIYELVMIVHYLVNLANLNGGLSLLCSTPSQLIPLKKGWRDMAVAP